LTKKNVKNMSIHITLTCMYKNYLESLFMLFSFLPLPFYIISDQ